MDLDGTETIAEGPDPSRKTCLTETSPRSRGPYPPSPTVHPTPKGRRPEEPRRPGRGVGDESWSGTVAAKGGA